MSTKKAAASRRLRAPKREGQRKQLTVPDDLVASAERFAEANQTSDNDALVQLATLGALSFERDQLVRERADARRAAIRAAMDRNSAEPRVMTMAEANEIAMAYRNSTDRG